MLNLSVNEVVEEICTAYQEVNSSQSFGQVIKSFKKAFKKMNKKEFVNKMSKDISEQALQR